MNDQDVSQCMRGLANLRLPSRVLVQTLVARAFSILDTFDMQVCSLLYALHIDLGLCTELCQLGVGNMQAAA